MQDQLKCRLFVLCSLEIKMSSLKALEIEFAFFSSPWESRHCIFSVATNLENMESLEKSGNLKDCQNLREIRIFVGKNMENSGEMLNM